MGTPPFSLLSFGSMPFGTKEVERCACSHSILPTRNMQATMPVTRLAWARYGCAARRGGSGMRARSPRNAQMTAAGFAGIARTVFRREDAAGRKSQRNTFHE
jgi:hypothetical protein